MGFFISVKKYFMKKLFAIVLGSVLIVSCSNDEDKGPAVERVSDDYQPNTVGSSWTYTSSFFDFTQTATNKTKSISGKSYFQFNVEIDGFSSFKTYARKEGNAYINREVYDGQYDDGEYIYLKDAVEGTTWTEYTYDEVDDEVIETEDVLEIIETNGTYTVDGEEFNNVIVVQVSSLSEGATEPYIILYYYAKGVGLIKVEDEGEFAATELLEYSINE